MAAEPLLSADFSQQVALLTAQQPADVEKIGALQQLRVKLTHGAAGQKALVITP